MPLRLRKDLAQAQTTAEIASQAIAEAWQLETGLPSCAESPQNIRHSINGGHEDREADSQNLVGQLYG
jgi:hypothetical protein